MEFVNKITGYVLALVLGAILVGGLLIPTVQAITDTDATLTNTGYYHMTKYAADGADMEFSWDHTNPRIITINDEAYSLDLPLNQWFSIIISDDWCLRYADGLAAIYLQTKGDVSNLSMDSNGVRDLDIVCSNGTATMTLYISGEAQTPITKTYTEVYAYSGDAGSYVMKKSDEAAYMAADSEFLGFGTTAIGGSDVAAMRVEGNIEDGATATVIASTVAGTTASDVTINSTPLDNYHGYAFTSASFDITANGNDYPAVYSYVVVPAQVTLEKSWHLDTTEIAMFGVISILGIIMLVVVAANAIRVKY